MFEKKNTSTEKDSWRDWLWHTTLFAKFWQFWKTRDLFSYVKHFQILHEYCVWNISKNFLAQVFETSFLFIRNILETVFFFLEIFSV